MHAGRRELAPLHGTQHDADVFPLERRLAGQETVKRGTEAVDIRPRAEPVEFPGSLLRAHVGRRAQRTARQRLGRPAGRRGHERPLVARRVGLGPPQRLGQAPVDDQRLAVLADDHVGRLQVAVQDAAAVRVLDGVADVQEPPQQFPQLQRATPGSFFSVSSAWKRSMASLSESPRMNRMA